MVQKSKSESVDNHEPVDSKITELDEKKQKNDTENAVKKETPKPENNSKGAIKLRSWLNKTFRVEMSDGRILIGIFLCTDRDRNIILGSCAEYLPPKNPGETEPPEQPRALGLVMVPGKHIVSIHLDDISANEFKQPVSPIIPDEQVVDERNPDEINQTL